MVFSPDEMVFAHILMKRTQKNLEEMRKSEDMVSVNATLGQVSYEIMAKVKSYDTSGPNYQRMDETLERIGSRSSLKSTACASSVSGSSDRKRSGTRAPVRRRAPGSSNLCNMGGPNGPNDD